MTIAEQKGRVLRTLIAAAALSLPAGVLHAQAADRIMPRMSVARAQSLQGNPAAWNAFVAALPEGAGQPATTPAFTSTAGGTWSTLPVAPVAGLGNPLLLTDGTVMVQDAGSYKWLRLTPDIHGNYANGTWSRLASMPMIDGVQYSPLYHSSAVLPDGRVIIMGGEYNNFVPDWTNMGAIYDPVSNSWVALAPPPGWGYFANGTGVIGDAESIVLPDGTYLQAACCLLPAGDAMLDAATLDWTETPAPSHGNFYQDEQGYTLLPNGHVLTLDIWSDFDFSTGVASGNATNAEQYEPKTGVWVSAGNTPVSLVDPWECGNFEIGPAVVRPDGTVVAFGGNTGCAAVRSKADPTAIYSVATNSWSAGPDVPAVCGKGGKSHCDLADAPAALLPDGNILFAASAGYGSRPTHFFEFTTDNRIVQVSDTLKYAATSGAFYYNFLVLPSGQILATDFSRTAEIYTPQGAPNPAWAPVIRQYPPTVNPGGLYEISGTQFNGLSQGSAYGDDSQAATNYPLVQITNDSTGDVFYARTAYHSTMSIAPGTHGSTTFEVPAGIEAGPSTLQVIANGIASAAVPLYVN